MEQSKSHLNLSVDAGVVQSAREKGLNLSSICEDAIRQILNTFETTTLPANCKHKWTWPFSIASGLAKECLKCGTIQKVKLESMEETNKRIDKQDAKS